MNSELQKYLDVIKNYLVDTDNKSSIYLLEKLIYRAEQTQEYEQSLINTLAKFDTIAFRKFCEPIAFYWKSLDCANAVDGIDSAIANCGDFNINNIALKTIYLVYETDRWITTKSKRLIGNNVNLCCLIDNLKRLDPCLKTEDIESLNNICQTQNKDINYLIETLDINEIDLN